MPCQIVLRRRQLNGAGGFSKADTRLQVALGIIKAAEKHLLAMDDMEEMVEFLKNDVPSWDVQTLQARVFHWGAMKPALMTDLLQQMLCRPRVGRSSKGKWFSAAASSINAL